MTFTNRELQKCAEREVAMRRNVFRRRGMGANHVREIALMAAIAEHFRELAEADELAGRDPDGQMFMEFRNGGGLATPLYKRGDE